MLEGSKPLIVKDSKVKIGGWEYVDAIRSLRPNALFNLSNGKFSQYYDPDGLSIPTDEEIEKQALFLKETAYQRKRYSEYPSVLDFVDAYYWEKKGDSSKMDSYISKIDFIKQKYPKPE
jgi:hypothetical protein